MTLYYTPSLDSDSQTFLHRCDAKVGVASRVRTAICLPILAIAALLNVGDASAESKPVKFAFFPGSVVTWLTQVADDRGYFQREGIQPDFQSVRDGPTALTALVSNSVDITTHSTLLFVSLASKGQKVQLISGQTNQLTAMVVRPGLATDAPFPASVAALKGKKIGIQALSSETHYLANLILGAAGLSPNDVQYVTGATSAQALASGTVDASIMVAQQLLIAGSMGAKTLVDLRTAGNCPGKIAPVCGIAQIGMWGRADWVKANPGLVMGIRKAIASADVFVHNPANRAEVLKSISKHLPNDASNELKEKYVDYLLSVSTAVTKRADMETWSRIALAEGLITRAPDSQDLFAPGTAESEKAVRELAR